MTPAIWLAAIATLSLFVSFGGLAYTWSTNRRRASHEQIAALLSELSAMGNRLQELEERRAKSSGELRDRIVRVEEHMVHMPTQQVAHDLALRMEQMHGDMKGMSEALKGVQGQLETVNAHLMNEARRT